MCACTHKAMILSSSCIYQPTEESRPHLPPLVCSLTLILTFAPSGSFVLTLSFACRATVCLILYQTCLPPLPLLNGFAFSRLSSISLHGLALPPSHSRQSSHKIQGLQDREFQNMSLQAQVGRKKRDERNIQCPIPPSIPPPTPKSKIA